MFYIALLHTFNSFLSALSIGEMAFGFGLHAYMTFAITYLGTINLRRRQFVGGEGLKIGQMTDSSKKTADRVG